MKNNGKEPCQACWLTETANAGKRCTECVKADRPICKNPRHLLTAGLRPRKRPRPAKTVAESFSIIPPGTKIYTIRFG